MKCPSCEKEYPDHVSAAGFKEPNLCDICTIPIEDYYWVCLACANKWDVFYGSYCPECDSEDIDQREGKL